MNSLELLPRTILGLVQIINYRMKINAVNGFAILFGSRFIAHYCAHTLSLCLGSPFVLL